MTWTQVLMAVSAVVTVLSAPKRSNTCARPFGTRRGRGGRTRGTAHGRPHRDGRGATSACCAASDCGRTKATISDTTDDVNVRHRLTNDRLAYVLVVSNVALLTVSLV